MPVTRCLCFMGLKPPPGIAKKLVQAGFSAVQPAMADLIVTQSQYLLDRERVYGILRENPNVIFALAERETFDRRLRLVQYGMNFIFIGSPWLDSEWRWKRILKKAFRHVGWE